MPRKPPKGGAQTKPPQLATFNSKQQQLYSELPPDVQVPHLISKPPYHGNSFQPLVSVILLADLGHYPKLETISEVWWSSGSGEVATLVALKVWWRRLTVVLAEVQVEALEGTDSTYLWLGIFRGNHGMCVLMSQLCQLCKLCHCCQLLRKESRYWLSSKSLEVTPWCHCPICITGHVHWIIMRCRREELHCGRDKRWVKNTLIMCRTANKQVFLGERDVWNTQLSLLSLQPEPR